MMKQTFLEFRLDIRQSTRMTICGTKPAHSTLYSYRYAWMLEATSIFAFPMVVISCMRFASDRGTTTSKFCWLPTSWHVAAGSRTRSLRWIWGEKTLFICLWQEVKKRITRAMLESANLSLTWTLSSKSWIERS